MSPTNIIEKNGDLFTSHAEAYGHGVNVKGVMGRGIAKTLRSLYPEVFAPYKKACDEGLLTPGTVLPVMASDGTLIMNMATQDLPGPNASYQWLDSSLANTLAYLRENGIVSLALPRIGAGIGGLDWDLVRNIIDTQAEHYPEITIEIWTF